MAIDLFVTLGFDSPIRNTPPPPKKERNKNNCIVSSTENQRCVFFPQNSRKRPRFDRTFSLTKNQNFLCILVARDTK